MDDLTIARAVHVLSIVLWIGGVGMVTTAVLPAARRLPDPTDGMAMFHRIEAAFSPQARLWVLLAGASGLYMLMRIDDWNRFTLLAYWWMYAMIAVWLVFAIMLFIVEPLLTHRQIANHRQAASERSLRMIAQLHWILLVASLVTILGAVAGSHGMFVFD